MASKIHAGITPSETQEHIIFVLVGDGGRGGSFVCQKSHNEMVCLRRSKGRGERKLDEIRQRKVNEN